MPITRSKSAHNNSTSHPNDAGPLANAAANHEAAHPVDTISLVEEHLSGLLKSVKTLRREIAELRKKNAELEEDLTSAREEVENATQPKRGAKARTGARELQKRVSELRGQVRYLEKARAKDRRRIAKLRASEIKRDARELQDDAEVEVGDSAYKMRKLLRRFHDLMVANPLETDEECAICMTPMEVGKARSFPCEHTFCEDCTNQVAGDAEIVRCPTCRSEASRDDLDVVEYTATTQWDELLAVAARWAKMDHRGEQDTSEEEAEETFIDDDETAETRSAASEMPLGNPLESSPEPEGDGGQMNASQTSRISRRVTSPPDENTASSSRSKQEAEPIMEADADAERPSTPDPPQPSNSQPGYLQSPAAEKRKRMEELAHMRALKKQRL